MKFYLSRDGQQLGPWSAEEIKQRLEKKEISWTDYLFDEFSKEWVFLMEHPKFSETFKKLAHAPPSQSPAIVETAPIAQETEWFVLKDNNKYGPFKYLELIKMLQERKLYEYDFLWQSQMPHWRRVSEIEDFQVGRIQQLVASDAPEVKSAFFRRRYQRASYGASLVIHNSKSVWKGHSLEIGPGGAGIIVEGASFDIGQSLFLHFKAGDGVPPFNAICTVIGKAVVSGNMPSVRYGVKFTTISQSIQHAIMFYTDKAA